MRMVCFASTSLLVISASIATAAAAPITFGFTGGIVTYIVPATGLYGIVATGAQGGRSPLGPPGGGFAAQIGGDFLLSGGEVLQIAVGGAGGDGANYENSFSHDGGGGGGSFVVRAGTIPLVIAGGGGGSAFGSPGGNGLSGPDGGNGDTGAGIYPDGTSGGKGGTGGSGGESGYDGSAHSNGAGGSGFNGAGKRNEDLYSFSGGGGGAFPDLAGGGGAVSYSGNGGDGGFGGGGGAGDSGAGGGGGYSGGGGGGTIVLMYWTTGGGGGGGSFLSPYALNPFSTTSVATSGGNGLVTIDQMSPSPTTIPEPASLAVLSAGLLGLALRLRR